MFCVLKKKKAYLFKIYMFQNISQIMKKYVKLLMISNRMKMALSCSKNIISIIKRNNTKNNVDFYCLNCLHSFRTKNKLELHKAKTKTLEFDQY